MNAPVDRERILEAAASIGWVGPSAVGASRILATLCDREISAKQVAVVVKSEPVVYARVLKVANSPYYGQSRNISSLDRAIVTLGLEAVRGIVAVVSLDRAIPRTKEFSPIDTMALLRHSLATATAAELLARVHDPSLAGEAFIGGLLHNLGIIVQFYIDRPGIISMINARLADPSRDMRILEVERSTVRHDECAGIIFEAWRLPSPLVSATRHHHDPMAAPLPHRRLAALVSLGANLGLAGGDTFLLEPAPTVRNVAAMECLGLDDEQLDAVACRVADGVGALRRALAAA